MSSIAKAAAHRLLASMGLQVSRIAETSANEYPVEFDEADRAIVDHVVANRLSMAARERLFATLLACRHVCEAGIPGDFVECGVWRGGNSLIAADVFRRYAPNRHVYLFDTFAGMTAPTDRDVSIHGTQAAPKF